MATVMPRLLTLRPATVILGFPATMIALAPATHGVLAIGLSHRIEALTGMVPAITAAVTIVAIGADAAGKAVNNLSANFLRGQ
jgi:hypothetical protein